MKYQGPVKKGFSEDRFRKTGKHSKEFYTTKNLKKLGRVLEELTRPSKTRPSKKSLKKIAILGVPKFKPKLPQIREARVDKRAIIERLNRLRMAQMTQQNQISPNTLAMLQRLRMVQNKAKFDDSNMQRIKAEQRLLADAGNLLKTPNLFGQDSQKFDILNMNDNILNAPNQFRENEGTRILNTGRPSLLHTKEVGNNLSFGFT